MKQKLDMHEAQALREQSTRLAALNDIISSKGDILRKTIFPLRVRIFGAIEAQNDPNISDEDVFRLYTSVNQPDGSVREMLDEYKNVLKDYTAATKEAAQIRSVLKKPIEAFFKKQHEALLGIYYSRLGTIIKGLQPFCRDAEEAEFLAMQTSTATTLYSAAAEWNFSSMYDPSLTNLCDKMLKNLSSLPS